MILWNIADRTQLFAAVAPFRSMHVYSTTLYLLYASKCLLTTNLTSSVHIEFLTL